MKSKGLHIVVGLLLAVLSSSCSIRKFVPEGQYLVKNNKVVIEEKGTEINKSKLSSYIALRPYKSSFQTNIPTWFYYKSEQHADSKFWHWMNEKFGRDPVYYVKAEADRSAEQMMRYLNKTGYFHSKVTHEVETKGKKAKVKYIVEPTEPYRVNKMEYVIGDSVMSGFIMRDSDKFALHEGDIYNEFALGDEREMITERLRNSGYYFFNRDHVKYEVDSNFLNHSLSVTMRISNDQLAHRRYTVNSINVYPDFSVFNMNGTPVDSTTLRIELGRRRLPNTVSFFYYDKPKVKPQTFPSYIQIVDGRPYSLRSVTGTYQSLSSLRLFNNVNISFDTIPDASDSLHLLDCKITMQQGDVHSVTLQADGTNSDGDLGIKGSLSYTNKNIFHGAETFQLSVRGGLEAQRLLPLGETTPKRFNTWELGVTTSLMFPKFLSPIPLRSFARDYHPTTSIGFGFNSQTRYYYSRYVTSASFGYDWKSNYRLRHTLTPVYLNSVKIDNIDSTFQAFLNAETNQRKKDQYTNHLIFGTRYSFTYNTQSMNKSGSFFYFRADLESSGNLLSLFNNTKLLTEKDGHHELLGIRYAQYVRGSFDVRQHIDLGRNSWLVFRQFVGLGLPYGNSDDIPFERSFYSGGANSLRGWSYHNVGPGGYVPEQSDFEKIGDMQIELNAEYRFPVYKIVNGAVFVDAGNVWLVNPNTSIPNGEFRFGDFYKQVALDAGFGVRLDVSFLIIRLDMAYAMRNPYPDANNSYWRFGKEGNLKFNMGIGYPF